MQAYDAKEEATVRTQLPHAIYYDDEHFKYPYRTPAKLLQAYMEDFFTTPRLSLDSEDLESNPVWTPLVSPLLESSQSFNSHSMYDTGYMFDMSFGATAWEPLSMHKLLGKIICLTM